MNQNKSPRNHILNRSPSDGAIEDKLHNNLNKSQPVK